MKLQNQVKFHFICSEWEKRYKNKNGKKQAKAYIFKLNRMKIIIYYIYTTIKTNKCVF